MAAINGTLNAVLSGSDKALHNQSAVLNVNVETADTSTKDSGGWATHIPGTRDWSISISGVYDTTGSGLTPDEILAAIIARSADTTIKFTTDAPTNTTGWTGDGTFVDINITGDRETTMQYTATIKGNGPLAAI